MNTVKTVAGGIFQNIWGLKWWLKALLLISIFGGGYWVYSQSTKGVAEKVSYQTEKVEKGTLVASVTASGAVASVNSSSITTRASGVIKRVLVKDGDQVKSGQALLEIDLDQGAKQNWSQALASYQSAKNNLESAKANLHTMQSKAFAANVKLMNDAVERELASDDPTYIQQNADWLAAEANYKNQEAAIVQAQTNLNTAFMSYLESSPIVYAPISGKVSGLSLQVGSVLSNDSSTSNTSGVTATKIAKVVTDAQPSISVNLTDIDVIKVKVGDLASVSFEAFSGKVFAGKVVSVDLVGSSTSGVTNYPVVIQLNDKVEGILPNMSANAGIITETKDGVLMVPNEAIVTENGEDYVRVMKNGKVELVAVEIGIASESKTEIISGVSEGEEVVSGVLSQGEGSAPQTTSSPFSMFGGTGRSSGGGVRTNIQIRQ